jgi:chaperonin GroEL
LPTDPTELKGWKIVQETLEMPLVQIIKNAGKDHEKILADLPSDFMIGYDAQNDKICHLIENGVIDPTKVVRRAFEDAISIAGLYLMTECIITSDKEIVIEPGMASTYLNGTPVRL